MLVQSVFGNSRPPVLLFGYHPSCGAGERDEHRALVAADLGTGNSRAPRMLYSHGGEVHTYNAVTNTLRYAGMHEVASDTMKWSLYWGGCPKPAELREFHPFQKTNHFPASWQLGRKDLMWRNIRQMQRRWPKLFDITPMSYVLPGSAGPWGAAREQRPEALWIWKPVNSSCGRGIRVLPSDLGPELERRLASRAGVVQQYVQRPLLLDGYKFDLRLYVVVTSFDPLKAYLNSEGLVRLATERYDPSVRKLRSRTMHLTNYSVNKHAAAYVRDGDGRSRAAAGHGHGHGRAARAGCEEASEEERGGEEGGGSSESAGSGAEAAPARASKWSLQQLREHFAAESLDFELMMARIKDLAVKALIAVEPAIVSAWHQGANFRGGARHLRGVGPNQTCFEIYGFDVIIDEALTPWLLEVNIMPSLSSSSPLDKRIKTKLVADTLTLVGFSPFGHKLTGQVMRDEQEGRPRRSHAVPQACQKSHSIRSLESSSLRELGEAEWALILDAHDEFMRRGSLERIFPTRETADRYAELFQTPRYSNCVLAKWLREGGEECFRAGCGHLRPAWVPEQTLFDAC